MAGPATLEQQVRKNLPKVEARPEFVGELLWLTFYLCGAPENLRSVCEALKAHGWLNLEGCEGGFLYPKIRVVKSVAAIVEAAESMQELCAPLDVTIDLIDADTLPDVEQSQCEILYRGI